MSLERFYDFRQKEVINVCDGVRLGFVCDLEFEISGRIVSLIVLEQKNGFRFFGKCREFRIPWKCIRRIGDDIILVEVNNIETLSITFDS